MNAMNATISPLSLSKRAGFVVISVISAVMSSGSLVILALDNADFERNRPVLGFFTEQFALFLAGYLASTLLVLGTLFVLNRRYNSIVTRIPDAIGRKSWIGIVVLLFLCLAVTGYFAVLTFADSVKSAAFGYILPGVLVAVLWAGMPTTDGDALPVTRPFLNRLGTAVALLSTLITAGEVVWQLEESGRAATIWKAIILLTLAAALVIWIVLFIRSIRNDEASASRPASFSPATRTAIFIGMLLLWLPYWFGISRLPSFRSPALQAAPLGAMLALAAGLLGDWHERTERTFGGLTRPALVKGLFAASWLAIVFGLGLLLTQWFAQETSDLFFLIVYLMLVIGWGGILARILAEASDGDPLTDGWLRDKKAARWLWAVGGAAFALLYWAAAGRLFLALTYKLLIVPALIASIVLLAHGRNAAIRSHALENAITITLVTVGWLVLWLAPWQPVLKFWPWLRLIIAVMLFTFPGALCVGLLSRRERPEPIYAVTGGFVVSLAVTGLIGTLARSLELSFTIMMLLSGIFGGAVIVVYGLKKRYADSFMPHSPGKTDAAADWLKVILAAATLLLMLATIGKWGGDEVTNHAYITHWQNEDSLDYREIYFDHPYLDSQRFWMAHFFLAEAVLAEVSNLPAVVLLSTYLDPALTLFAVLAVYQLAYELGLSRKNALLAALAQVAAIILLTGYSQPGEVFIERLTEDKVAAAFIVAPVLLIALVRYLKKPSWGTFGVFGLCAVGMMYAHPTCLGMTALIAGGYGLLTAIHEKKVRSFIVVIAVLLAVIAPLFSLRFVDAPYKDRMEEVGYFSIEDETIPADDDARLFRTGDIRFYGFRLKLLVPPNVFTHNEASPGTVPGVLWNGVALLGLLWMGGLALKGEAGDPAARLVLASTAVLGIALIPVTAPLLGRLIGVYQLWRVPWVFPFGIGLLFAARETSRIFTLKSRWGLKNIHAPVGVGLLALLLFVQPTLLSDAAKIGTYDELAELSHYLDTLMDQPTTIVGFDKDTNDMLPGLSSHSRVIAFKYITEMSRHGTTREEAEQRWNDWLTLIRHSPADERLAVIEKYQVQYLVIFQGKGDSVLELSNDYPIHFESVRRMNSYDIYRVEEDGG